MRKLSEVEQFLVDNNDDEKYNLYRCPEDGIFFIRKDVDDGRCPYCQKECHRYEKGDIND